MRVLNEGQETFLRDERRVLNDLRGTLEQVGMETGDREALGQSISQLDELFLLVVVGEFNAGKSAVINALLGQRLLEEGVTPTTTQIQILRYGDGPQPNPADPPHRTLTFPVEFLKEISIVDTPGTNAILRHHEALTSQFVPRSDLVLFITSADRPFTESERGFLEVIRNWGKKIIFVVNKIDILQNSQEIFQVETFVRENAQRLLGDAPVLFPVSARAALRAKQGEPQAWPQSRFEALETYIRDTLDEGSRVRLKFLNPLGVGDHLAGQYRRVVESRLDFLRTDVSLLADVEGQLAAYREDMQHQFKFRMADLDNLLLEMESRGQAFFDETFRLARVFDLFSKTRIQQNFERQVVADVPLRIERKVHELIDWLVDSDLRQWQAIHKHLVERRQEHKDRIIGEMGMENFRYDRNRLLEDLGREARRVVGAYDKERESKAIAESALNTVAASAAMGAGALGLGALVTTLATTAAADVTGILMASLIAAVGLFIIPARRRQGKNKMVERIASLRTQLVQSLRGQFEKEIDRSLQHINETISPYTRFVRTEKEKLAGTGEKLAGLQGEMNRLKERLEKI
jgi:small GTP-binding protein